MPKLTIGYRNTRKAATQQGLSGGLSFRLVVRWNVVEFAGLPSLKDTWRLVMVLSRWLQGSGRAPVFLMTLLLVVASTAQANEWLGKVVHVVDGDTFDVLDAHKVTTRIRLAEIDTPERGRPWSKKATNALKGLVAGKQVRVREHEKDRWGRTVATVWIGDTGVNAWMVMEGHAWVYRRFSKSDALLELEEQARKEQKGLWGLPESERLNMWLW